MFERIRDLGCNKKGVINFQHNGKSQRKGKEGSTY